MFSEEYIITRFVPSGLTPAVKPRLGASAAILALAGDAAGGDAGDVEDAAGGGGGGVDGGGGVPESGSARIACCWATKVVDEAGQPTPGPLRF
jgi:hypothetical protein